MRVAYITAGAADMYCGSCIHDNTLAAALQEKGHQVVLVPTYTPLRTDEPNVSVKHLFYGGINVYLQQKLPLFRHTPWSFDQLLDRPSLLNWISRYARATSAKDLGSLTVSVLEGEEGPLKKELSKLVHWLKESVKPELVHLTNSMFLGLARRLRAELKVPILCSLQGEDIFLKSLVEPYQSRAMMMLRGRVPDADGFISTSHDYADFMSKFLDISREKINVVKLGLNLRDHGTLPQKDGGVPFVVGYLARICPEKGLHLLVEAFSDLVRRLGPTQLKLNVAGYLGPQDKDYFRCILKKISAWGLEEQFEYWGEVDLRQKIRFLNTLHILSVPTTYREPKGLYILEALANGVPVVQPRLGAFPELIEATGGGILVNSASASVLADGIQTLFQNPQRREELGQKGKIAVHRAFSDQTMAEATLAVYRRYTSPDGEKPKASLDSSEG